LFKAWRKQGSAIFLGSFCLLGREIERVVSWFFLREGLGLVVAAGLGGAICMFPTDLGNNNNNTAGWKSLELCGKSGNMIGID